jgi:hypothetical protein
MTVAPSDTTECTNPGWPAPAGAMIWVAKSLVNITGWSCRAPSSSHSTASPSCRPRLVIRMDLSHQ